MLKAVVKQVAERLLSSDPDALNPAQKEQMAAILKARAEMMSAGAALAALRARVWEGDAEAEVAAKAAQEAATEASKKFTALALPFLKDSVNPEPLVLAAPIVISALIQSIKVPLPFIFEALGTDTNKLKDDFDKLKKLFTEDFLEEDDEIESDYQKLLRQR